MRCVGGKSQQLQIRVTAEEKAAIRNLARRAGQPISAVVLARVLPAPRQRFGELLLALAQDDDRRFVLAELNDLLAGLSRVELPPAVADAELHALPAFLQNYVAAMVEQACGQRGVTPPAWASRVEPLDEPHFAVPFSSLRLHLLRAAPVPFKRRNIFVDSAVGDRV
jgi:hypothetical protein